MIYRVCLDRTYFAKTENWKHCSKIIFKYVNSNMEPNFNEKVTQKWDLWVPYTVHRTTKLIKKLKSQQLPATVHMNSSRCPLIECAAVWKKKKKWWRNVNANAKAGSKPSHRAPILPSSIHPKTTCQLWAPAVLAHLSTFWLN